MVWLRRHDANSPSELRKAYNQRHREGFLRDRDRFYKWMAQRMEAATGERILDCGCGGGYLLRELKHCQCFGIDISDTALAEAVRTVQEAYLLLAQGEALPFSSASFQQVACLGNLEHFLDPSAGVREMVRVTRPRGIVWVLLPNSYYSGDLWRVIRTGFGPNHHQPVERFATLKEWQELLEANGLKVLSVVPYNRFKWWKHLLPRNLAYHFLFKCQPKP